MCIYPVFKPEPVYLSTRGSASKCTKISHFTLKSKEKKIHLFICCVLLHCHKIIHVKICVLQAKTWFLINKRFWTCTSHKKNSTFHTKIKSAARLISDVCSVLVCLTKNGIFLPKIKRKKNCYDNSLKLLVFLLCCHEIIHVKLSSFQAWTCLLIHERFCFQMFSRFVLLTKNGTLWPKINKTLW